MADDKWCMMPRKHGYKRLPWVMYWPMMGLQTTELAPDDLYKGILNGSFDMLKHKAN